MSFKKTLCVVALSAVLSTCFAKQDSLFVVIPRFDEEIVGFNIALDEYESFVREFNSGMKSVFSRSKKTLVFIDSAQLAQVEPYKKDIALWVIHSYCQEPQGFGRRIGYIQSSLYYFDAQDRYLQARFCSANVKGCEASGDLVTLRGALRAVWSVLDRKVGARQLEPVVISPIEVMNYNPRLRCHENAFFIVPEYTSAVMGCIPTEDVQRYYMNMFRNFTTTLSGCRAFPITDNEVEALAPCNTKIYSFSVTSDRGQNGQLTIRGTQKGAVIYEKSSRLEKLHDWNTDDEFISDMRKIFAQIRSQVPR